MKGNMTEGKPLPIMLKFMLPLFIGNAFQQVYNAVDSVIVGNYVGADALAAVGSTGTIMFLMNGLAMGLTTGFTVLVSQKFGEGDMEGTKKAAGNGAVLSIFVILVMTLIFSLCMRPLLTAMNTPANIFEDAYSYISVICYGMVCLVGYNFLSSSLRAIGNSRVPLISLIVSACMNVVLDLWFIIGLHMGTAGAAWATVLSQGTSFLFCAIHIMRKEDAIRPSKKHFRLDRRFYLTQLRIGVPMSLQFGITASGTIIMQAAINLFGSVPVAAYAAVGKVHNIASMGMIAMGQTMATYAGQNFGARKPERIRDGVRKAVLVEIIYALATSAILYFGMPVYIKWFFDASVDLTPILSYANTIVLAWGLFYVPLSLIFIFRNVMQGCGFGLLPMLGGVVELIARLICAVAAMQTMQFVLAALCDPMAWLAAFLWTMICYFIVMKKVEKIMAKPLTA